MATLIAMECVMFLDAAKRDPFKINGVVIGIVIDNKDPEGRYRVKVKYPWVTESDSNYTDKADDEDFRSSWCRMTTLFSGGKDKDIGRGAFFLPEVDDEVLLAFEHGDLRRPYVVGALWNGVDKPIDNNDSQDGKNNFRSIISRSGHIIQFADNADGREDIIIQTFMDSKNDGSGDATRKDPHDRTGHFIRLTHGGNKGKRIEIYDTSKKNWIFIHTDDNMIEINSESNIHIKAKDEIHMECTDLKIEATNNISATAKNNVDVTATGGKMTLKASSLIKQNADKITLN